MPVSWGRPVEDYHINTLHIYSITIVNSLQSNNFTSLDLLDCSFDTSRGQQVQSSNLYRQLA